MVFRLSLQLHVAAEGDERDAAVGVAPLEADQAPAEAEGEDEDAHAEGLGRDEVAELVEEDHEAQHDDERGRVLQEGARTAHQTHTSILRELFFRPERGPAGEDQRHPRQGSRAPPLGHPAVRGDIRSAGRRCHGQD